MPPAASGAPGFGEVAVVLTIRAAHRSDAEQVLALWDRDGGPTRLPSTEDALIRLLETDAEALLIGEERGEIVGTLIVGWDGWRCHRYRLAVRGDCRRQGIATQLVSHGRERARMIGARRLDAMVDDDNSLAESFWSGIGFALNPSKDRRWVSPV